MHVPENHDPDFNSVFLKCQDANVVCNLVHLLWSPERRQQQHLESASQMQTYENSFEMFKSTHCRVQYVTDDARFCSWFQHAGYSTFYWAF